MTSLVNWPSWNYEDTDDWRDTGEGGLFAYAVWSNDTKHECVVDVYPRIGVADVLAGVRGPLSGEFYNQNSEFSGAMNEVFRDRTPAEVVYYETQIAVDNVLFLGSTSGSWFADYLGEYFTVDTEDLTDEGRNIINAISALYGEPTFLTYLDT